MTDSKELLSHYEPQLRLKAHLAQVGRAAEFLLAGHSPPVQQRRTETAAVLEALVACHDLGKGSPAFQDYIRDPARYRGDLHAKEHSGLSAALAILWARAQDWPPLQVLALAQGVAGHHAGFATLDRLRNTRLRADDDDVLIEQWQGLDRATLAEATELGLAGIDDDFEAGGRWLFRRQKVEKLLQALPVPEAIQFRLWTQFLFSLLLEADKAFLALREEKLRTYLHTPRPPLEAAWVDTRLEQLPATPLNPLRTQIRRQVLEHLADDHSCCTLTLPTGVGKTLLAASWALTSRERLAQESGVPPRIVIVLPYLSIIDQTEREYRKLLGVKPDGSAQSERLMASHSLSQHHYELEEQPLGDKYTAFYLNTWRSEVVLTTFDQLLLALFSPKTRHLMRFHALMDALIVLDEVQTLPCRLWDLVDQTLAALTREGNSRVLLMSATQPALLSNAQELVGDEQAVSAIFAGFRRYRISLRQRQETVLDDFVAELLPRIDNWIEAGKRVLITLNTRASARAVWDAVNAHLDGALPVHLISADVTPQDRLAKIAAVREGSPCVVVSTQTVEAGVDIDMDVVLRDFAPLDALVQVAGRCNRHNRRGEHGGEVEVIALRSAKGRRYGGMVYDPVLLDVTREVLEGKDTVGEEDVLALSRRYFAMLKERKNIGTDLTRAFAYWAWDENELPDIHTLLRGERRRQVTFLVLQDPEGAVLREAIREALAVPDRWDRRLALQRLAGSIQRRTVSVYARPDLHPEEFAEALGPFWDLREGYYDAERGLDLQLDEDNPACII